jgi:hypothetical protein
LAQNFQPFLIKLFSKKSSFLQILSVCREFRNDVFDGFHKFSAFSDQPLFEKIPVFYKYCQFAQNSGMTFFMDFINSQPFLVKLFFEKIPVFCKYFFGEAFFGASFLRKFQFSADTVSLLRIQI